ncbi:hypothetical protein CKAH01_14284 [Colletotrichum kahawae]|uniref:Uncharacterized protein n=1 Tax=Colletotrichum kahawae TaxID=34407 RepID=A0AAD9YKW5_COLKA|nr:hypothetical protein CKAH01_14284 [Colletotrichum kahawae]
MRPFFPHFRKVAFLRPSHQKHL